MILHPNILALLAASLLTSCMVLYSAAYGIQILRRWDLSSCSEQQLVLERKTYLISTIVSYFLGFQLVALFLFIFTVDSLSPLFVGAMCAVGSLTANDYGYPALLLNIINFLTAGLWLIINYSDNQGYDYPLIRIKYALLLCMTPLILAGTVVEVTYFLGLHPDIITSCCGSLFSTTSRSLSAEMAGLPSLPITLAFYGSMAATAVAGAIFLMTDKGARIFATLCGITAVIAVIAIIAVFSLYIYQLPSHHCPFCILQQEYGYLGYPLYLSLLTGAITGMGAGVLDPFRKKASLAATIPPFQRTLARTALICYLIFTLIATWPMVFSNFKMAG